MAADARGWRVGGLVLVVASVASAGYAVAAASTTPFTWAADVMTALPIAAVVVGAVWSWPAHPVRPESLVEEGRPPPRHPYRAWVLLLTVVVAWELAEYLWRGSRGAHPTLSSMADALDAHTAAKGVAFFAWLWSGAAVVRAGTRSGSAAVRARS